jgi:hypothetical protein
VEDRLLSADGYRESLALDTAIGALQRYGVERKSVEQAIGRLVDERLLVTEERSGVRRIEISNKHFSESDSNIGLRQSSMHSISIFYDICSC